MMDANAVTNFIANFHGAEHVFLHGCCYWFAWILKQRFGAYIVYEPVEGHFLSFVPEVDTCFPIAFSGKTVSLHGRLYDIRGDVTDRYLDCDVYSVEWIRRYEPNWYNHLMRDCRDFLPPTDDEPEAEASCTMMTCRSTGAPDWLADDNATEMVTPRLGTDYTFIANQATTTNGLAITTGFLNADEIAQGIRDIVNEAITINVGTGHN